MQTEIEAKFLDVDHDKVRAKLRELGAELEHPMRLMRRTMFDYPDMRLKKANWGRLRVRDEGDKITFAYKSQSSSEYSKEIETTVGSYDKMVELLLVIGLKVYTFEESKRETWQYQGVEIVLDEWPWLKPYIEIEGESEAAIKTVAAELGFDWKQAFFGSIDTAYLQQYPGMNTNESISQIGELRFGEAMPQWLKDRL